MLHPHNKSDQFLCSFLPALSLPFILASTPAHLHCRLAAFVTFVSPKVTHSFIIPAVLNNCMGQYYPPQRRGFCLLQASGLNSVSISSNSTTAVQLWRVYPFPSSSCRWIRACLYLKTGTSANVQDSAGSTFLTVMRAYTWLPLRPQLRHPVCWDFGVTMSRQILSLPMFAARYSSMFSRFLAATVFWSQGWNYLFRCTRMAHMLNTRCRG